MHQIHYNLMAKRRFLPLFITQFLNALNDNIFNNAMVILITYQIMSDSPYKALMVTLASSVFILPFFLFSATAGQLADKYDKTMITRLIKFFEIVFIAIGIFGLYQNSIPMMMLTLFLMGTHSAFFGPIKYAILPDLLQKNELICGNSFVEASTFIATLVGTILGGVLILLNYGVLITGFVMLSISICGWISSFFIPLTKPANPNIRVNRNFLFESWSSLQYATQHPEPFLAMMGISWFWVVGGVFLSQFPNYTYYTLHANAHVVTLFLAIFSVGIALGSLLCNKLIKEEINPKFIPLTMLMMSLFSADLYFTSDQMIQPQGMFTFIGFITEVSHWRTIIDLFSLAISMGLFVVPLYTILQTKSEDDHRARMIACNNMINSFCMAVSYGVIMLLLARHMTISQIFLVIAVANAGVTMVMTKLSDEVLNLEQLDEISELS